MAQITILNSSNVPQGPFTREQVAQKLTAGEFTLDSLAHVEGLMQWTPLREVLAKVDAALAPPPPPPVPPIKSAFATGAPPPFSTPGYSYAATMEPPAHLVYAGFWLRFAAVVIDSIILAIVFGILGGIFGGIMGALYGVMYPGTSFAIKNSEGSFNIAFVLIEVCTLVFTGICKWLYYALMESSSAQATIGKQVIGIRVTDLEGNRIGFGRATGRYFGKLISAATLCIGFIMAGFTERKQALHDMLASTLVVRR